MALFDTHANFAWSTILTIPSPASTGTTLTVQAGDGAKFPAVPFNAVVAPAATQPTTANAEIIRVTNIVGDTFTFIRTQESSNARTMLVGDQIGNCETVKVFTDIEALAAGTSTITTTGTQVALALPTGSGPLTIFANNATTLTIQGIAAGLKGQRLNIISIGAGTVVVQHKNGGAAAANQLANNPAQDQTLVAGVMATSYVYDTTASFWRQDTLVGLIPYTSQATGDLLVATSANAVGRVAAVAAGSILVSNTATTAPKYTASLTNGQVLIGSTGADAVPSTLTAGANITVTNAAGSITVAASGFAMSLLKANSGSSTAAGATNVDTVAISGLTAKDTLKIYGTYTSTTSTTGAVLLYTTTDAAAFVGLRTMGAAGNVAFEYTLRQAQVAATTYMSYAYYVSDEAGTPNAIVSLQVGSLTAWTGSWTLAFRYASLAGGAFQWSWSVFKIAGQ